MTLTGQEEKVLNLLADAWNEFIKLDKRSSSDDQEFIQAIHTAQAKIGVRVARRVDPDIWRTPT